MVSPVTLKSSRSLAPMVDYAYSASAPAGTRLIFLAGACPLGVDGLTVSPGDFAGQAAQAVANLRTALVEAGATMSSVLNTRVLVASASAEDLRMVWAVVRAAFGEHGPPSTLMGVTALGYNDQLVEIEAVAAAVD
ncbi:MAG: enamine deaminase RidA [Glaciihabitans sp.]|nr:enamine deaminase RidA [Glaciihabitans sp.]